MRFLVTRPQPDCRKTADLLRAQGHVADELPALVMKTEVPSSFDLDTVAGLAITSRRVVPLLANHQQFPEIQKVPVFAVGEATAQACVESGFKSVRFSEGGVEALGSLILDNRTELYSGIVLYPAARERAGDLEAQLGAGGLNCKTVIIYRMDAVEDLPADIASRLGEKSYDGVLIYSRRTAEAFVSLIKSFQLEHIFSDLSVYAISRQAAEPLSMYSGVRVAAAPCQKALLELVLAEC